MADRTLSRGRRVALVVALAALVTLSGCSFLGGDGAADNQVASDYIAANGTVDRAALEEAHTGRLESADNFTSRTDIAVEGNRSTFRIDRRVRVGRESDRALEKATVELVLDGNESTFDVDTYTEGETTYRRSRSSAGEQSRTSYQGGNGRVTPVNTTSATLAELPTNVAEVNWTRNGTERVAGVRTARLEASGVDNFGDFRPAATENESLGNLDPEFTSLSAVMNVDDDGVIRRLTIDGEGTQGEQSLAVTAEFRITNIGSTTVERPSWYDTAREEAGGQS
jgi:hypothetical protein